MRDCGVSSNSPLNGLPPSGTLPTVEIEAEQRAVICIVGQTVGGKLARFEWAKVWVKLVSTRGRQANAGTSTKKKIPTPHKITKGEHSGHDGL